MTYLNFVPGPSQLSGETKNDIKEAVEQNITSLSHRSEAFYEIFRGAREGVRGLLGVPDNYRIYFVSSATECMEIIARNATSSKSYHFVNGSFSKRFADVSRAVGNEVLVREIGAGEAFDFSKEELPQDADYELVCINHTETPTGVSVNQEELAIFRKKYPRSFIAVDIVSSVGTQVIDLDLADIWFFSVQKGLGLPAGLGVLIVHERVLEKAEELAEKGRDLGGYHSLLKLDESAIKDQTFETPNVLNIYLLKKQTERLSKIGLAQIEEQTRRKADYIYRWAEGMGLNLCAKDSKYRSVSVACLELPKGIDFKEFHRILNEKGIFPGSGYKEMKETHFRIANFWVHKLEDMEVLTGEIEKIMKKK